jgi:hypothetical protein
VACYVYGFAPPDAKIPELRGVADAPARAVPIDGLAAVVAEIDDAALDEGGFDNSDASRHLDVLLAVLESGPVLPVAFGTIAPDEDSLGEQVRARAPHLRDQLERVRDVVEIDVTGLDDETSSVAAVVAAAPEQFPAGGDPLVLGDRVATEVMQYRADMAENLLARLREVSVEDAIRRRASSPEDPFLQWAFLVDRNGLDRFDGVVAELMQERPNLVLQTVGPLPAFSFVSTTLNEDPSATSAAEQTAATASGETDPFRSGNWGW